MKALGGHSTLLVASGNQGKLREIRVLLEDLPLEVRTAEEAGIAWDPPVEDGETYAHNAVIKAESLVTAGGFPVMADDSGLEVDHLDGAPGVHSARYAGTGSNRDERDTANNRKLLDALREVPASERTARFVCVMCLADPEGRILAETRGTMPGVITDAPRGANGFGYDPLLYLPDVDCTSAELPPEAKNARSHRGEAVRKLAELLSERLAD